MSADAFTLPSLRPDLQLFPAPSDADGSPSFTLFDPLSGGYKRIGWAEATLLGQWRPGLTIAAFLERIHRYTTLRTDEAEVMAFCRSVHERGLTAESQRRSAMSLRAESEARAVTPLKWLLSHYLFIRVPVIYPDRMLRRTLPLVRLVVAPPVVVLMVMMTILALALVAGQIESYVYTFPDFFSMRGALAYGLTLIGVKTLHEFAHAYTATALGARVRSMGLAFIVFWPVPYSDVTDAWRLPSRRSRFLIGFAGIAAETALAGLALFGWCVAPPGPLKDVCFLTSSVTLISTWIVNINPAMRFDGYYLLADAWGVENLQPRAFALTKWWLRKELLGLEVPPPEPVPPARRMAGFILYSVYAWLYRVGLYVGIAVLLYHRFWKFLGVVLFLLEIHTFLVKPVLREASGLWRTRGAIRFSPRIVLSSILVCLLLLWFCLPLSGTMSLPAVLIPERDQALYTPSAGVIRDITFRRGDKLRRGEAVFRMASASRRAHLRALEAQMRALDAEERVARTAPDGSERLPELIEERSRLRAEREAALAEEEASVVVAAHEGVLIEWGDGLEDGVHLPADLPLGRLVDPGSGRVVAYLSESELGRLEPNFLARFVAASDRAALPVGTLQQVAVVPVGMLEHTQLSVHAGGPIPVRFDAQGAMHPIDSLYRVEVPLAEMPLGSSFGSGRLVVGTRPRSRFLSLLRHLRRVLLRESGF